MSLPYEGAVSGEQARAEIIKILKKFGATKVGFMEDFEDRSLLLAFVYRGRNVQMRASAQGWANAYLEENPWSKRRRYDEHNWKQRALNQGLIAINSVLRDWVKGQITAIETGIVTFDHVFLPYMLTHDGRTAYEHMQEHLPALEDRRDTYAP